MRLSKRVSDHYAARHTAFPILLRIGVQGLQVAADPLFNSRRESIVSVVGELVDEA